MADDTKRKARPTRPGPAQRAAAQATRTATPQGEAPAAPQAPRSAPAAPTPQAAPTPTPAAPQDAPAGDERTSYNWPLWRRRYYTSTQSLSALAEMEGAPSLRMLEYRSSQEEWPTLRAEYRERTQNTVQAAHTQMVLDARRDMVTLGTSLMSVAGMGLQKFAGPEGAQLAQTLRPAELVSLAQAGTAIRRQALGMDTLPSNVPQSLEDLLELDTDSMIAFLDHLENGGSLRKKGRKHRA